MRKNKNLLSAEKYWVGSLVEYHGKVRRCIGVSTNEADFQDGTAGCCDKRRGISFTGQLEVLSSDYGTFYIPSDEATRL